MIRRCNYCGEKYDTQGHGKEYCSQKCYLKQRTKESEEKRKRICQWCGEPFIMRWKSGKAYNGEVKEGLFCSRKCRGLWRRNQPKKNYPSCKVYFPICSVCKTQFTAQYSSQRCCSDECKYNKYKKTQRRKYRNDNGLVKRKTNCIVCGKEIETWFQDQVICSRKCRVKLNHAQRRAKEQGAFYESISLYKLFSRDNGRCQICGRKLNLNRKIPHPLTATRDHITPLSKGGKHRYKNIQLACFKCNSSKGNRFIEHGEQHRLF